MRHPVAVPRSEVVHCAAELSTGEPPSWVVIINDALEQSASSYAAAYVILDLSLTMALLLLLLALRVPVDADFALAYAIAKGIGKGPRLALDATTAAALARFYPALAAVRVSLLLDAMGRSFRALNPFSWIRVHPTKGQSAPSPPNSTASPPPVGPSDTPMRAVRVMRAAEEVKRLTDRYGLAYFAAKNLLGPVCVLLVYAGLQARGV